MNQNKANKELYNKIADVIKILQCAEFEADVYSSWAIEQLQEAIDDHYSGSDGRQDEACLSAHGTGCIRC